MITHHLPFVTILLALFGGCTSNDHGATTQQSHAGLSSYTPSAGVRTTDPVYAYLDAVRSDLKRGKVQIINDVMQLSPQESDTFWTIYHDYEDELFALGDQRMELTRRYVATLRANKMDDKTATELGTAWWEYETQRLALVKKYYERLQKELSPVRAAQFAQIEHRVGIVVDLIAASDLPLIAGEY